MKAKFPLTSDLDDTLLGDSKALARFAEFHQSLDQQLAIVYASGRFFSTIVPDVQMTPLPEPVAVIGGVGSEIRDFKSGKLNKNWLQLTSQNWSAEKVKQLLTGEPALQLQPDDSQSDFKVSYFLQNASQRQLDRLQEKLAAGGMKVSIIYSSERDLDFLPEGVDKGAAARFIAAELGFEKSQVMVAGNSGNDSKLFDHDFQGIVVNNAHEQLKLYARSPHAYLSPREHADGVRDGIKHWMMAANR